MAATSGGAVWLVSRHAGALEWLRRRGVRGQVVRHLDPRRVRAGDVVVGVLPVALAAQVCARGGRFIALEVEVPEEWRGRELSAEELERLGARLVEYRVRCVGEVGADEWRGAESGDGR